MLKEKRRVGRPTKVPGLKATYRQVAVTPKAHAKLRELSIKNNMSIIDTIDQLLNV